MPRRTNRATETINVMRMAAGHWKQRMHDRCTAEGHRKEIGHPNRCKWCGEIGLFRYEDREDSNAK